MNYGTPKTIKELTEDAKFSADFLENEAEQAFKSLNDIVKFVHNGEVFLFNNCYFNKNKKIGVMELENKEVNITNLYKITFGVYESAKQFLISLNVYLPFFYGYEKLTAHFYKRDGE